jgi:membrane protein implicated in regulation of membrane protease activity
MRRESNPIARQFATLILMVMMVAGGAAAFAALVGATNLSLQICGGAIFISVAILVMGAFVVARTRPPDDLDAG